MATFARRLINFGRFLNPIHRRACQTDKDDENEKSLNE